MFDWFRRKKPDLESLRGSEPPIPYGDLRDLFAHLNRPNPPPCDHSHRETRAFLEGRGLALEPTMRWLCAHGGFCDCEVIFNVEQEWGERVGYEAPEEG